MNSLLRIGFSLLVVLHGLIHLMGFVKGFNLMPVTAITTGMSRTAGSLWMVAAVLLVTSGVMLVSSSAAWIIPGILGAILSQALIITTWADAKYGTVVNVALVVALVFVLADRGFQRLGARDAQSLLAKGQPVRGTITASDLDQVPVPVSRWLRHVGMVGQPWTPIINLSQTGQLKISPKGNWIGFEADQLDLTAEAGFLWRAKTLGVPRIAVKDTYIDGKGEMLVKLESLIPVAHGLGPETDQGALLRYLSEICWFPAAAMNPMVKWLPLSEITAKATLTDGALSVEGIFEFSPEGDVLSFEAMRYYARPTGATLEPWRIECTQWAVFDGIRVPCHCEVIWKLATGDFRWLKLDVNSLTQSAG